MERMEKLFEPIKIGKLEIKNRIAYAPTHMSFCTEDGLLTDQALCYYVARARGGTGLIIVEVAIPIDKYGRGIVRVLGCQSDAHLDGLRTLAEAIHACGAKAVVQVTLGFGSQALYPKNDKEVVGPSDVPTIIPPEAVPKAMSFGEKTIGKTPRPLTVPEIEELEDAFVAGVERIKKAGFDGIELHGPHGYLLAQFLSPYNNKRTDQYGGSFEKRMTLPRNVIRKARERVGSNFLIGYRFSSDEHIEGGYNLEDGQRIAVELEKAGVDFLELSSGRFEAFKYTIPEKEGVMLDESRAIKQAVKVPVICPNIHDPRTAERALQEGRCDMVSLSRALISDPAWANKAKEGKCDEIKRCIFCYMCLKTVLNGFSVRCTANPDVGRERFMPEYYPPPWRG